MKRVDLPWTAEIPVVTCTMVTDTRNILKWEKKKKKKKNYKKNFIRGRDFNIKNNLKKTIHFGVLRINFSDRATIIAMKNFLIPLMKDNLWTGGWKCL